MDYGGWGIRVGRGGTAYTVKGKYGIQLVKKNGKRILMGTQQPEEAAQFIEGQPIVCSKKKERRRVVNALYSSLDVRSGVKKKASLNFPLPQWQL